MFRIFHGLIVLSVIGVLAAVPASASAAGASPVVQGFQAVLLDTMKQAKALGVKGRYERLGPAIKEAFHLPLMMATASAPYWRDGTAAQRTRLLAAFQRMSASTVATLFDDYGGETFRVVRERKSAGPTVLVDTQVVRPGDDPVDITFVAARLQERWWIIDLIVGGGISEVRVRRNEYMRFLREGGLDRLAQALDEQADHLLARKPETTAAR
jgi:phospholipid transport system substrate-binding protein